MKLNKLSITVALLLGVGQAYAGDGETTTITQNGDHGTAQYIQSLSMVNEVTINQGANSDYAKAYATVVGTENALVINQGGPLDVIGDATAEDMPLYDSTVRVNISGDSNGAGGDAGTETTLSAGPVGDFAMSDFVPVRFANQTSAPLTVVQSGEYQAIGLDIVGDDNQAYIRQGSPDTSTSDLLNNQHGSVIDVTVSGDSNLLRFVQYGSHQEIDDAENSGLNTQDFSVYGDNNTVQAFQSGSENLLSGAVNESDNLVMTEQGGNGNEINLRDVAVDGKVVMDAKDSVVNVYQQGRRHKAEIGVAATDAEMYLRQEGNSGGTGHSADLSQTSDADGSLIAAQQFGDGATHFLTVYQNVAEATAYANQSGSGNSAVINQTTAP